MKKIGRDYAVLAAMAGAIVLLDQVSKAYVRSQLAFGEMWSPWEWLTPYARIVHWFNTGVAFGMFKGLGPLFAILPMLVSLAIIYYYSRVPARDWVLRLSLGLQLGGALGNLIDRVTLGQVTDFISIGNFPVFNVADASITVGVIVLILGVYLQERREKAALLAEESIISNPEIPPEGEQQL